MVALKPSHQPPLNVVPAGTLRKLLPDEIKPSSNNPRYLFDEAPLAELKKTLLNTASSCRSPCTKPRASPNFQF